ncbi:MAG: hypothetical protein KGI51_13445 [Rhodospirillales bacterium]|nr:hypothetical protein [Rhodospirillales bacterium]
MRTLSDLPAPDRNRLTELGHRKGTSCAALVREAVHPYLDAQPRARANDAFGAWGPGADGLAYQDRMRAE